MAHAQPQLVPDFLEALPLAVVVAKNVDGVILSQPAVKLLEKFAPLDLGDLRFWRALRQRTKRLQRGEERSAARLKFRLQPVRGTSQSWIANVGVANFNGCKSALADFPQ